MAGGVGVIGSLFPFAFLCIQRKSNGDHDRLHFLEKFMDKEQDKMAKKGNKSDDVSKTTSLVTLESSSPVTVRTTIVRAKHNRPVSFIVRLPLRLLESVSV